MRRLVLLLVLLAVAGCSPTYSKCPQCHTAYKQEWYQLGLPGQGLNCHCGVRLEKGITKAESGWRDGVEPNVYGY